MKKILLTLSILCALILGSYLRLHQLGSIPWALNRDEASIGYNAYSILKTGHDEHGVFWPINVESFGDWKLPIYMYASIPFISLFGLNAWAVRLPSALAGIALIPAAYYFFLSFNNKKNNTSVAIAHVFSWLVAISPWSLRLSRIAYEANLALLLAVLGAAFIVRGILSKKASYLIPGLFLAFSTMLTYHAYQVFMPLFLVVLLITYRIEILTILKQQRGLVVSSVFVAVLFGLVLLVGNTSDANQTKYSGLSAFSEETYHFRLFDKRMAFEDPTSLQAKIYANSVTMIIENLTKNVAAILSPEFLVINGGSHGSHDIQGIGNMYVITGLLVIIGIFYTFRNPSVSRKTRVSTVLIGWLCVGFVAPVITTEAAHSIRFSPALFAFEGLAAYAIVTLLQNLQKPVLRFSVVGFISLSLIYSLIQTTGTYFVIFPQRDHHKWPWYSQQVSLDILTLQSNYKQIIFPQIDSSPYIFLLFDWQYDPTQLAENLEYYTTDSGGFKHASRLENIYFIPMDWKAFVSSSEPLLTFSEAQEFEKQNLRADDYKILKKYESNNAESTFYLISNE